MASMPNSPLVVFVDVLDQYSFNADLACKFKYSSSYESSGKDSVAIFKLGWSQVTEYVAIKSVPDVFSDKICSVTFNRLVLPKNTTDLYQLCYICGHDLHGASTPFQFCEEATPLLSLDSFPSKAFSSYENSTERQILVEKEQEINRLKDENAILRESLKALLASKTGSTCKDYDTDIKELKDLVESLKTMLLIHDGDIKMLKNKIKEGGEEYKKLYLEKYRVQKKYEKLKSSYMDRKPLLEENQPMNDFNLDLGELKSIPPFPPIFKH